ncbi:MAG: hypothetical protein J6Y78_00195 [Paludibacteraceae bacterium]|nr:hypothetical protein [Paludibacteraceae bacterium]
MKKYSTYSMLVLIALFFNGCSIFDKIEITDYHYIRVPSKAVKHFSISVYYDVDYQGGITYSFRDNSDSSEVVLANHPFPAPTHFTTILPYNLRNLQQDTAIHEQVLTWSGCGDNIQCLYDNDEDMYAIVPPFTYWEAHLISKPCFAPNIDWYLIGFHHVPKNKVKSYKNVFRLKKHVHPLKKRAPWAPLFGQSSIDNIYKTY